MVIHGPKITKRQNLIQLSSVNIEMGLNDYDLTQVYRRSYGVRTGLISFGGDVLPDDLYVNNHFGKVSITGFLTDLSSIL